MHGLGECFLTCRFHNICGCLLGNPSVPKICKKNYRSFSQVVHLGIWDVVKSVKISHMLQSCANDILYDDDVDLGGQVDQWKKMSHSNLVTLRQVFTSKSFGDHSMVFVYDFFPGSETLMSRYFLLKSVKIGTRHWSHCRHFSHPNQLGVSLLDPFNGDGSRPYRYCLIHKYVSSMWIAIVGIVGLTICENLILILANLAVRQRTLCWDSKRPLPTARGCFRSLSSGTTSSNSPLP